MIEVLFLNYMIEMKDDCKCEAVRTDQVCEGLASDNEGKVKFLLLEEREDAPHTYRPAKGYVSIEC